MNICSVQRVQAARQPSGSAIRVGGREPNRFLSRPAREFGLTSGLIKNVVVRAAFLAAREDRKLGTGLLRRAATLELEDMGRVVRAA